MCEYFTATGMILPSQKGYIYLLISRGTKSACNTQLYNFPISSHLLRRVCWYRYSPSMAVFTWSAHVLNVPEQRLNSARHPGTHVPFVSFPLQGEGALGWKLAWWERHVLTSLEGSELLHLCNSKQCPAWTSVQTRALQKKPRFSSRAIIKASPFFCVRVLHSIAVDTKNLSRSFWSPSISH